jgi:hypothetical protein
LSLKGARKGSSGPTDATCCHQRAVYTYKYTDFLTSKSFQDGQGQAERTGYADQDSKLELFTAAATLTAPATEFVHVGQRPNTRRFLHTDFAKAVRVALAADQVLSPIAAAAQAEPPGRVVESGRHCFIFRDGLLYHQSSSSDSLCI